LNSVVGVIPVRFGATRFPGKPLAPILHKPMLQWVLEGVSQSQKIQKIIVATDHEEIASVATKLGYEVAMTDSHLPSGSDRVWAAVKDLPYDIIVNIQGDEPLIRGDVLDHLVTQTELAENADCGAWTLGHALTEETLHSQQVAKVVMDEKGRALYFSRLPIPFSRKPFGEFKNIPCLKHIGIYAYRKKFLQKFCEQSPIGIEEAEGLEQLRALYLRGNIKIVKVEHDCWGVDIPSDVQKIEKILMSQKNEKK
jgi:3-deoxy-manno-octulosonate cytidylyltransferase (CMP-KDO synthetase)